jgi:aarF domain-containing kinase
MSSAIRHFYRLQSCILTILLFGNSVAFIVPSSSSSSSLILITTSENTPLTSRAMNNVDEGMTTTTTKPETASKVVTGTRLFSVGRGEPSFFKKMLRRFTVFSVAFQVFLRYKWAGFQADRQKRRLSLDLTDPNSDDHPEILRLWSDVHTRNANNLLINIQRLEGFWVKVGQYLSSRADVMPSEYLQALSVLQDSMPPRSWDETYRTITEEFGGEELVKKRFVSIDPKPLATASLAQVHRATLKVDGNKRSRQDVVIKVQHRGVAQLMLQDMDNLTVILNLLAKTDPDLDFNPVIKEYNQEVRKELDFRTEAKNMKEVKELLEATDIDVIVPESVPDLVTERCLVMEFCEGFPVRDIAKLDRYNVDRELLLERVCAAWAVQMHVGGIFNADPHTGNILVSTAVPGDASVPVLLDFGLTKRLNPKIKLAFARLMHASNENDIDSLMQSFDEMGLKLNRTNPFEDMANMRRGFGSTVPQSEAKEVSKRKRLDMQRRTEARKADAGLQKGQKLRSPVDAWPSELIFFGRVTNMLRGMCSRLDIRYPYLETMAKFARETICESVPATDRALDLIHPSSNRISTPMQDRLVEALKQINEDGNMVGLQICVLRHGEEIVNIAAGTMGIANSRPVTPSTLFNVFSVTKGVLTIGLLRLVQDGRIKSLDDPVYTYWPEFESKPEVTVRHLLAHQSGLASSFPEDATIDTLLDWALMTKFIAEKAVSSHVPGEETEYHALSFAWLVGGLIEAVTGEPYEKLFDEILPTTIHSENSLRDDLFIAGISDNVDNDKDLAVISMQRDNVIDDKNQKDHRAISYSKSTSPQNKSNNSTDEEDHEDEETKKEKAKKVLDKYRGIQQLMNPSIFNMRKVREAKLPSANGHASAVSLARVFDAVIRDGTHYRGEPILSPSTLELARIPSRTTKSSVNSDATNGSDTNQDKKSSLRYDDRIGFGLGFELHEFTLSNGKKAMSIGHNGLGGSVVIAIPEEQIVVSFTLNLLSMNSLARRRILGIIFDELGCIAPASIPVIHVESPKQVVTK